MEEEYVVLRSLGDDPGRVLSGTRGIGQAMAGIELGVQRTSIESADVPDMRRDRGVIDMAPLMPIVLVAPVAAAASETPGGDRGPAWGLAAVGALGSRFTGRGVKVAVLDTGIDAGHEAFRGKAIVQMDFTKDGDGDSNGHGTHCAGTVFGGEVGGRRIGVAPGVEEALIGKVLDRHGRGSTDQVLDGIIWASRRGASLISVSLGLDFPGMVRRLIEKQSLEVEPATSRALTAYRENVRLFDSLSSLLRARGAMLSKTVVFAASGNESRRPRYTIATSPPATADGFIAVGAIGAADAAPGRFTVAPFSNTGPAIVAPGVNILSAKAGGGLCTMSGTSMAAPHVAGVAALWLEKLGGAQALSSIDELKGRLLGRAVPDQIDSPTRSVDCGAGLVQAPAV